MTPRSIFIGACLAVVLFADSAFAQTNRLPSTEQFMNTLGTCAANMNLSLSGDLLGSIRSFYEGKQTQGKMALQNAPAFLSLFPENERTKAYTLYVECVTKIISGSRSPADTPPQCTNTFNECRDSFKISSEAAVSACQKYLSCDSNNPIVYSYLGQAQRGLGHLSAAESSFNNQLRLGEKLHDRDTIGQANQSLAILALMRGTPDAAEMFVRKSISINEGGNRVGLGANYKVLGDIYFRKGNLDAAENSFRKAIEILEPIGDKLGVGNTYIGFGYTRLRRNDRISGCTYLHKAKSYFSELDSPKSMNEIEGHLTRTHC